MSENTYQALAEAHRNTLWHKPGRLKPGEVPRPWPWPIEPSETSLNKGINTMTHPLDKAVRKAAFCASDMQPFRNNPSESQKILEGILKEASLLSGFYPQRRLAHIAATAFHWLLEMGVRNPWQDMIDEYDRAKQKHGDMTLDSDKPTDEQRFYALMEEVGKIARALTYDRDHAGNLAKEITQLGALALAWLTHKLDKDNTNE